MRQRESKVFAEILNRLREGKQTEDDIMKIKKRCTDDKNCPRQAHRLFTQNVLVDDYNQTVYQTSTGNKYTINAHDSVIGANPAELRDKIMRQIPHVPLKNTKQSARKLRVAEGERTEIALNVRTDDGLTNGASNVVKLVKLNQLNKPSGIIWVQFDDEDVRRKTRHENRHLFHMEGIQPTWTPIKPVTTQFSVGRTKSAQVVRKQFPLRPAAAKTVHRSQGDTQTQTQTQFSPHDDDQMYAINGFHLFRNDDLISNQNNRRPSHSTAVYSKLPFVEGYPYSNNINGIEFIVIKVTNYEDINIIGVYCSPQVPLAKLCSALQHIVDHSINNNIFIGDFNVNWLVEVERQSLYNIMVRDNGYRQLIQNPTTDNNTLIDHIFTNIVNMETDSGNLET